MSSDDVKNDFAIQLVINDSDGMNDGYEISESDNSEEEIVLNQMAITSVTLDSTDESNVHEMIGENGSNGKATKKSVTLTTADDKDNQHKKAGLTNKSMHLNETCTIENEKITKQKSILKSVTFNKDVGVQNAVQALENDSSEADMNLQDENDLSEIDDLSEEIDEDSEPSSNHASKSELQHHVERLRSSGKIEKVALIDFNGSILIRSIGMEINSEDAETVLCVLRSPDMSLVKIRVGKQDFTCFKNSTDSFVGKAENDFLHVRSCLDFIVVCMSDPSSPGSCIYEVSRFVKRYYRTSVVSTSELESALV